MTRPDPTPPGPTPPDLTPPAWTRPEALVLAAILLLALVLRAGAVLAIPSPVESDYLGYYTMATNLLAGRGLLGIDGQPTAFLNIGYPVFLRGLFGVFGPSVGVAEAANVVLGTATVGLVHVAARRLFRSVPVAALAALLAATYPEPLVYTAYMAKENLVCFMVLAQLALVSGPVARRRWLPNALLFGLLTGCQAVVGNSSLFLLPGLFLQVWWITAALADTARARAGLVARHLVVTVLVAAVVVAPALWRNHQAFGAWVMNNNGGFNLYIGNNPAATTTFETIVNTPVGPDWQATYARLGERGVDLMLRDLAVDYIRTHPGETVVRALRKGVAFWAPPLHEGRGGNSGTAETAMRLAWLADYLLISALFLAALLRLPRDRRPLATMWVMLLGFTAVHMVFFGMSRYRIPLMYVMCIGAGAGAQLILARLGGRLGGGAAQVQ